LRRYGEALIYTNTDSGLSKTLSFNKTVSSYIGGYTFTLPGVNLWTAYGPFATYGPGASGENMLPRGPRVFYASGAHDMPAYSLRIYSMPEWQNVSGSLTIRVQKPNNANIRMYLMVK
jgi:hypothetical protein